ncbi:hypothetical protein B0T14DRAFT_48263 [Immersiella caudata]|uniref:Uncharacterized protein n=1 Tax=Immersiella caudata TaxID=314043 RepID=A0AA40CBS1_9PEZI|nr:hypothetical protein B0T14DRAFT_48263 [Immersiella caudata]
MSSSIFIITLSRRETRGSGDQTTRRHNQEDKSSGALDGMRRGWLMVIGSFVSGGGRNWDLSENALRWLASEPNLQLFRQGALGATGATVAAWWRGGVHEGLHMLERLLTLVLCLFRADASRATWNIHGFPNMCGNRSVEVLKSFCSFGIAWMGRRVPHSHGLLRLSFWGGASDMLFDGDLLRVGYFDTVRLCSGLTALLARHPVFTFDLVICIRTPWPYHLHGSTFPPVSAERKGRGQVDERLLRRMANGSSEGKRVR